MSYLLDSNLLIALGVDDHVHHYAALAWFAGIDQRFATCPITEGALVRILLRHGVTVGAASVVLAGFTNHPAHEFWPDDLSYNDVPLVGVIGHRQVTDAYLAALARRHQSPLATFDQGLAALHPDVATLVPAVGGG